MICIDDNPDENPQHSYIGRGLHVVTDDLCQIRRCVWCDAEQFRPYRLRGRKPKWRTLRADAV